MAGIFTKIINRELPAHIVAEDENFIAFLDINPLAHGHVLAIPKQEVDYIFDLDNALYTGLFLFAKRVANAIYQAVPCQKVGIAVVGLEVPHAHVHLVPLQNVSDLNFEREKLHPSAEELADMRERLLQFMPKEMKP